MRPSSASSRSSRRSTSSSAFACGRSSRHRSTPFPRSDASSVAGTDPKKNVLFARWCLYVLPPRRELYAHGPRSVKRPVAISRKPRPGPTGRAARGPSGLLRCRVPGPPGRDRTGRARPYETGRPIPTVAYAPEEHALWALVSRASCGRSTSSTRAPSTSRQPIASRCPRDRVPQLGQVTGRLEWLTGLPPRTGAGPRADAHLLRRARANAASCRRSTSATTRCRSTHPSPTSCTSSSATPTCSRARCSPRCTRRPGQASRRARTDAALEFFSRVFWFTLEFGVRVGARRAARRTAPGCCRRSVSSRCSATPRRARSTSSRWAPSTTTSRATSPCCSPASIVQRDRRRRRRVLRVLRRRAGREAARLSRM